MEQGEKLSFHQDLLLPFVRTVGFRKSVEFLKRFTIGTVFKFLFYFHFYLIFFTDIFVTKLFVDLSVCFIARPKKGKLFTPSITEARFDIYEATKPTADVCLFNTNFSYFVMCLTYRNDFFL